MFKVNAMTVIQDRLDDRSNARHRQFIGYIGLALPWLLIAIVTWRDGWQVFKDLDSVSAYYYSGASALFTGMLFVLGLFLAAYEGYANRLQKWDRLFARVAAIAALIVALFPTDVPLDFTVLAWWRPWVGKLHIGAAIVLFLVFAVFSLWLFRATEQSAALPGQVSQAAPVVDPNKRWRNDFYLVCGLAILACIGWAGVNHFGGRPIFWPEAGALTFFALSWLVKGYFLKSMAAMPGATARTVRSWFASRGDKPKP